MGTYRKDIKVNPIPLISNQDRPIRGVENSEARTKVLEHQSLLRKLENERYGSVSLLG
jgi:hypothetical protein